MADDIDRANELAEKERNAILASGGIARNGPDGCRKCGEKDWRVREGYAICDSCMLDMSGEAS